MTGETRAGPHAGAPSEQGASPTDIAMLNYALTLEHLEHAFYRDGLDKFGERKLEIAEFFAGLGTYLSRSAYENFVRIRNHEQTHVDTLTPSSRAWAVSPCPSAPTTSGTAFTRSASSLRRTVLGEQGQAFDGAIANIEAAKLIPRRRRSPRGAHHASYLNLLNQRRAVPIGFRRGVAPRDDLQRVTGRERRVHRELPEAVRSL